MSTATKNQERLAGIIAEIVTTLGIDVGDCNLGPGPDICALGDEAVVALKSRPSSTPSGRAEELIADLEAEIVKRDARIVELEGALSLHEETLADWGTLRLELAALKSKQQRGGVVLPERDDRAAYEAFYTEKAKTLPLSLGNSPLRYSGGQYINDFALFGWIVWNASLDEVARLNQSGECVAVLDWAVDRWHAEVSQRPMVNVHRRSIDETWRQIIKRLGGDPVDLCGPDHSTLLAQQGKAVGDE